MQYPIANPPPTNNSKFSAEIVEEPIDTMSLPTILPTLILALLPKRGCFDRLIVSPLL